MRSIVEVAIGAAADHSAVGGVISMLRIEGDGVGANKPHDFVGPTAGGQVNNRGQYASEPTVYKTAIPVKEGSTISLKGFLLGDADPGKGRMCVEIRYSDKPGIASETWRARASIALAVNSTEYELTAGCDGAATLTRDNVPNECTQCVAVGVSGVSNAAAVGQATFRAKLEGLGFVDQPQEIVGPSYAGQLNTADPQGISARVTYPTFAVKGGGVLAPKLCFVGDDTGTCSGGVCYCFR